MVKQGQVVETAVCGGNAGAEDGDWGGLGLGQGSTAHGEKVRTENRDGEAELPFRYGAAVPTYSSHAAGRKMHSQSQGELSEEDLDNIVGMASRYGA